MLIFVPAVVFAVFRAAAFAVVMLRRLFLSRSGAVVHTTAARMYTSALVQELKCLLRRLGE
jgi:hypothetical protein